MSAVRNCLKWFKLQFRPDPEKHVFLLGVEPLDRDIFAAIRKGRWLPEDFHTLRHTCAVRLIEQSVGIEFVRDHLGHRDIRHTIVYAAITDKARRGVEKELASKWRPN